MDKFLGDVLFRRYRTPQSGLRSEVPLAGQTLWPSKGYNPEVIGNLANAGQVPDNFAARNFAMVAPVSAGTPPQDFSLLLDIEGSDIWLPSIRCDTCAADKQEQENFYHATESKSFHPHLASTPFGLAPRAVSVNEGGGHVGGYVINDTLSIGSLQAPSQTEQNALTSDGYYDPARIEGVLRHQLAELYGMITAYNKKTVDFCTHHYEVCKQAQMENHELRARMAVMKNSVSTKNKNNRDDAPLQNLMSKQHLQATKLLVRKDCEVRNAAVENAALRDQLVQTQRMMHQMEGERRSATADGSSYQMSLCEVESPTSSPMNRPQSGRVVTSAPKPAFEESQVGMGEGETWRIARHPWFDITVMCAITLNSFWLGIDAAWNDSDVLIQTDIIFLVIENMFCVFFVIELVIRFAAYQRKMSAFRDVEWVVDLVLVLLMVLEIWALAIIQLATMSGTPSTFNPAFLRLTRVFKFFRMVRLVRLLRYMPEIIILVKGLGVASRSVFFTLCLLGLLIYVYGIAFKHLCKETPVGLEYFNTLSGSMFTLLYSACFFDGIHALAQMMFAESIIFGGLLMSFLLLAPLTVMNMLVGVLVQVLQVLSQVENDSITATFLREQTVKVFNLMDINNDGKVDIEEFSRLVKQSGMVKALQEADIDVAALIQEADLIFNGQERLDIDEFVSQIQAFRRTNQVTIKDRTPQLRTATFRAERGTSCAELLSGDPDVPCSWQGYYVWSQLCLQIRDQPFLLAEEGDLTARRERAWDRGIGMEGVGFRGSNPKAWVRHMSCLSDGVMGLGRKRPLTGGPSLHQSLVAQGRPATYILAPQTGRYLEEKAGRLALGVAPERLEYIGPFTWVDVLNSAGSAKGGWSFLATGKVNDLPPRPVMAMIETGTSYLLVPAKEYLSIVRSLVPTFDQHCGYDEEVGNIVVCDCEAKNSVTGEVVLQINARDGEEYKLQLNSRNLLQEAPAKRDHKHWMANNEEVCVLQIQQLPANDRDSAYGILGHPFADRGRSPFGFLHPGPFPGSMMGPLLIPLGAGPNGPLSPLMRPGMPPPPPGGMPGLPISKGELKKAAEEASEIGEVVQGMAEAVEKAKEKNERGGGLMKELLDSLAHMPGTGKVMKEEVTQMMPNGDRCTTELVRAANGTVLHERTWLVDDDGNKQREATPGQCPKHKQRRLEEQPRQLAQDDFWVLGDVFLRRHVVAFDFAGNRLGFAVEEAPASRRSRPLLCP
ncbi:unnamed protein product [Effrenium voratum]|nr:unnamed protein product [Effrenium voratum]